MTNILNPASLKEAFRLSLAGSVLALLGAYISQYGFGLRPCELCLLQRHPYFLVIALSVITWKIHNIRLLRILLATVTLLFAVETGIAGYHAGVEKGMFPGPSACTGGDTSQMTLDELRANILNSEVVACDQPAIEILGITMAGANMVYALILTILCARTIYRDRKGILHG